MSNTATQQLNKLYDSQLNTTKEELAQSYKQGLSDLDARKQEAARQTQKNLTRTAVEAQQAQKNYGEVQNAYGLSSGAMSQARLAQDNQLQADLTALRAAQQTADDGIERQRALLSQQYTSAIAQAQAENDLARAKALYEEAKQQEKDLNQRKQDAAKLMASAGDFSLYQSLFGLTPEQVAALERAYGSTVGTASGGSGGSSGSPGVVSVTDEATQAIKGTTSQISAGAKDTVQSIINGDTSTLVGSPVGSPPVESPMQTASDKILQGAATAKDAVQSLFKKPEKSSTANFRSVSHDVQAAVQAGKSRQSISEYIHSAVAAGYITPNQGRSLLSLYL